jgi:hypothetical protein
MGMCLRHAFVGLILLLGGRLRRTPAKMLMHGVRNVANHGILRRDDTALRLLELSLDGRGTHIELCKFCRGLLDALTCLVPLKVHIGEHVLVLLHREAQLDLR